MVFTIARSSLIVDEGAGPASCFIIGELLRRRFHEVAGWSGQRAGNAAIHRELGAANRVDDDAGGIGRVPHLELQLGIERDAAKRRTLEPDVGELAVGEPRDMIARPDMDVVGGEWDVELAGDGLRLGYLLRSDALALQHVLEIGVTAEIELVGAVEPHAALAKQIGEQAMQDGGADLALDVVADDRKARFLKAFLPGGR